MPAINERTCRNTAFLTELLINILVFSISCAVLAGVFGRAFAITRQTREEALAAAHLSAGLETLRAGEQSALPTPGVHLTHYDAHWTPCAEPAAVYTVQLQLGREATAAGMLYRITASAIRCADGASLCTLGTTLYHSGQGGGLA